MMMMMIGVDRKERWEESQDEQRDQWTMKIEEGNLLLVDKMNFQSDPERGDLVNCFESIENPLES